MAQADLFSSLRIGRESLISHGTAISTVADNLANSNTTGYKSSRAEFETLVADAIGSLFGDDESPGNGVAITKLALLTGQGPLDFTDRELDVAITGKGFFIARDVDGTELYTRAGNFTVDSAGNLTTATGETVMGFTAASPDTLVPLNLANVASAASPTTTATITGNVDSSSAIAPALLNPASFNELNAASQFNTSLTMVDSLGERHDIGLHFFHTANLNWTVAAFVDGAEVGGVAGTPVNVGQGAITFDATGSQGVAVVNPMNININWANGAAASAVALELGGMTGFATPSNISSLTADGVVPGATTGFSVAGDGTIVATLDNGTTASVGTIALALFNNEGGLSRASENKFFSTFESGDALVGNPNSLGRGELSSGALENSNVDPSNEFINMIQYQRGYQAGAQVIQTANSLLDTTLQIA